MSDFDSVYSEQVRLYESVLAKAQNAFDMMQRASAGGMIDQVPEAYSLATLKFDPGAPKLVSLHPLVSVEDIFKSIDEYISDISKIAPPQFSEVPADATMQNHRVWESSFTDSIYKNLTDYINSMGIPDVSYQNAIFNEDIERNKQTLADLYDLADSKTGARGFSYPNDFGNALKLDAQNKYQFDRTQISRKITQMIVEWARQNYQFAIEKGIGLESQQMDFTYKYCTAFIQIFKEIVTTQLMEFKASVDVLVTPVDALIKELLAVIEYGKTEAGVDQTNETLKQERSKIDISEAIQKYHADQTKAISEITQRFEVLKDIAKHSAAIAQSTASSVIATIKK